MKKNRLGRTELKVSQIVLGGGWVGGLFIDPDLGVMEKALVKAINAGINWIDTAESYSEGQSEKNIGLLWIDLKIYTITDIKQKSLPLDLEVLTWRLHDYSNEWRFRVEEVDLQVKTLLLLPVQPNTIPTLNLKQVENFLM